MRTNDFRPFTQSLYEHQATTTWTSKYPINTASDGADNVNGCQDCASMCPTCALGYGYTEEFVLYFELNDAVSGHDFLDDEHIEWDWDGGPGITYMTTMESIRICQGISPTVAGLAPMPLNTEDVVEELDVTDGENFVVLPSRSTAFNFAFTASTSEIVS